MTQISTLYSLKTDFNADSVEWCPHEPHQNVFVCGNYQLEKQDTESNLKSIRKGRILLFSIDPDTGLTLHQTLETSGVLDQKWCFNQIDGISYLGVANAEKSIEIFRLNSEMLQLEKQTSFKFESDSDLLILSLDLSTGKFSSEEPEIVCSDSHGQVHVLKFTTEKGLELLQSVKGHDLEAWISAFYYWDPNVYFSGADDCLMLKYDKRCGSTSIAQNRTHEAGVTSMQSNVLKEHMLVSGSYDGYLRTWDIRNLKSPKSDLKMPDTVWRIKWEPYQRNLLLVGCMRGGFQIVDCENLDNLKIIDSYEEHKDLAYGADWCFLKEDRVQKYKTNGQHILGTCSFYDNLLCVSVLEKA